MVDRRLHLIAPAGVITLLTCASCTAPVAPRSELFVESRAWVPALSSTPFGDDESQESPVAVDASIGEEEALAAIPDVEERDPSKWVSVAKRHTLGVSSGLSYYEADVELESFGPPVGAESGQDDSYLDPVYGGALKYNYFFNENFAAGFVLERRTFDASLIRPLSSAISPDEYSSIHYLFSTRFYTDPLESMERLKLFWGVDFGWVPGIELEADVIYSPTYRQTIALEGDEFFTLAGVVGTSWWVGDLIGTDASVELGAFYESALDPSEDDVVLQVPNGLGGLTPNPVHGEVVAQGVIFFAGMTFYL